VIGSLLNRMSNKTINTQAKIYKKSSSKTQNNADNMNIMSECSQQKKSLESGYQAAKICNSGKRHSVKA
jgi:hypothetical protein